MFIDPSSFVASWIAGHTLSKILDKFIALLKEKQSMGSFVNNKGKFDTIIGYFTLSNSNKLVSERENMINNFYKIYNNERLLCTSDIHLGYSQFLSFIEGMDDFVDEKDISITIVDEYSVDTALGYPGFFEAAKKYRKEKEGGNTPYPGPAVRIAGLTDCKAFLAKATYLDQYTTNQKEINDVRLDDISEIGGCEIKPADFNKTLRMINTHDSKLLSFEESPLSNTIGAAATVITIDGYLILPKRNKTVHFQSGYEGCSVSGVITWNKSFNRYFVEELKHQLLGIEGPEEIVLDPKKSRIVSLAISRELERAGKPQFFAHIWTDLKLSELKKEWQNSKWSKEEYDSIRWIKVLDTSKLDEPDVAAQELTNNMVALLHATSSIKLGHHKIVLGDECRANLFYLCAYLLSKKEKSFPKKWLNTID
jgi:hypothetical protein